MEHLLLIKFD